MVDDADSLRLRPKYSSVVMTSSAATCSVSAICRLVRQSSLPCPAFERSAPAPDAAMHPAPFGRSEDGRLRTLQAVIHDTLRRRNS